MSKTNPSKSFQKLTDFSSDINTGRDEPFRRIACKGGTQVTIVDETGEQTTIPVDDYALAVNNKAIFIKTIKADPLTDCDVIYAEK